ncbi:MAG: hypothetical protein FJX74_07015 [Armatimonadetes bacterium]|nr:hypothetical protein [Armatimonadota bacterium]
MGAKRLRRRPIALMGMLAQQLEPTEEQLLRLTCPGCGVQVEQTAHLCPQCGVLFYERQHGKAPRLPSTGPRETDPDVAEFARQMDHIERWTRILCVAGGCMFALLAGLSLWTLVGGSVDGGRTAMFGLLLFGLLSAVCFARGLKGEGAELGILDKTPGLRTFRMR